MNPENLKKLLISLEKGKTRAADVYKKIKNFPSESLGFATLDHHREVRRGFPEVIFGEGKTKKQLIIIANKLFNKDSGFLATRIDEPVYKALKKNIKSLKYNKLSKTVYYKSKSIKDALGTILVITAGTSDLSVSEEAVITASVMGNKVQTLNDVGVAGIHRILSQNVVLENAKIIIVVAGMEGALASVVAGLTSKPVIAVPTSVGYGASFQGVTALLGMLNSCSGGITVVNIDNGFGAGYAASLINHL